MAKKTSITRELIRATNISRRRKANPSRLTTIESCSKWADCPMTLARV